MIGAREPEGHLWLQQAFDQNGIVRQYTKWDHLLKFQDNPGLTVSRALQVACTEPRGPVYLSIPREVSLAKADNARFPTLDQLGVGRPAAPEPDGVRELAARLVKADNPIVVVSRSGRNPATVPALVRFCELMGLPVAQSAKRSYQCFPFTHPLYQGSVSLTDADVVLVLDVDIPWMIGPNAPSDDAFVAMVDVEPSKRRIPIMEFTADLRLTADTLLTLEALESEVRAISSAADRERFAARAKRWGETSERRRQALADNAKAAAGNTPIDVRWLSYQIGQALEDDWLVFDDTIGVKSGSRLSSMRAAELLFLQSCQQWRMGAGGSIWRQARSPRSQCRRDHRRRLLHVRHGYPFAVVGSAIQGAVSHDRLPEPQLFDRNASRVAQLSGRLCCQSRLSRRVLRAADRLCC